MNKKIWEEKKYRKILEIGEGMYQILQPGDPFVSVLYSTIPESYENRFTCACITTSPTSATVTADFVCEGFKIPKKSIVVAWRTFRYCEHDGIPHYNADDNIIFPDEKGNIWKVARNDSRDHYVQVATWAGLSHIAEAYYLPTDNRGPYYKYIENGATVPIKIECREKKE